MRIGHTATFRRQLKALPIELQEESLEVIRAFADRKNHVRLKVHKLKGRLVGEFAFSVNYRIRIIFEYRRPDSVVLLAIGDHDVYRS